MRGIGKPYVKSLDRLDRGQIYPLPTPHSPPHPTPPPFYGSNWSHQIADIVFLPYIYLSVPCGTLVCVWETFRLRRLRILFSL